MVDKTVARSLFERKALTITLTPSSDISYCRMTAEKFSKYQKIVFIAGVVFYFILTKIVNRHYPANLSQENQRLQGICLKKNMLFAFKSSVNLVKNIRPGKSFPSRLLIQEKCVKYFFGSLETDILEWY